MEIQSVKQRFGIIGNAPGLNRAIEVAMQVAPTDIAVLVGGESGSGKEVMPKIIHALSHRKHAQYIAVNCGAMPEGTIDSELFGHEKGAFTGATDTRKGYFEVADGGTIFLDEVAEMPMQTQVRLLRVLETGEFIKVGSSKVQKTEVRVVAATNKDIPKEIAEGRFREDLYYRLNTVPIKLPPLRERREDISLLFRKFAVDYSDKYRMPPIRLDETADSYIQHHQWPGNIRQLRNLVEQMSVIEKRREIDVATIERYLPPHERRLPAVIEKKESAGEFSDREILYKVLFDMKNDMNQLKALVADLLNRNSSIALSDENEEFAKQLYKETDGVVPDEPKKQVTLEYEILDERARPDVEIEPFQEHVVVEESLSLIDKEKELIIKALDKHNNRRKRAAEELGISERTLYRKIKEYDIN